MGYYKDIDIRLREISQDYKEYIFLKVLLIAYLLTGNKKWIDCNLKLKGFWRQYQK